MTHPLALPVPGDASPKTTGRDSRTAPVRLVHRAAWVAALTVASRKRAGA